MDIYYSTQLFDTQPSLALIRSLGHRKLVICVRQLLISSPSQSVADSNFRSYHSMCPLHLA